MENSDVLESGSHVNLSWSIATPLAAVALLLGGYGFFRLLNPAVEDNQALQKEIAQLESDVVVAKQRAAAAHEAAQKPKTELKQIRDENTRLAERIASRTADVRKLEIANLNQIESVRTDIDASRNKMSEEIRNANKALANAADKAAEQREMQDFLTRVQTAIVTVVSSKETVGTGFCLAGFNNLTFLTLSELAPANAEILVKVRYRTGAQGGDRVGAGKAVVVHRDEQTGLAFLQLEQGTGARFTVFEAKVLRAAQTGEPFYAVATQILGDQLLEFNTFDGTVSSAERTVGNRKLLQLSLPANPGSSGAPLFSRDFGLLGVLLGPIPGMEKTSLAISAPDIAKAIERAKR